MDANYWQNRYKENETGWDTGAITTPIKTYFDAIKNKALKILIPGCGNAHEAAYLWNQGFEHVYLCDWAAAPLANFAKANPSFPEKQLLHKDFFELEQKFDCVVEQTFFCALPRNMRKKYAQKMAEILEPKGKIVGLMFANEFEREGPPFGGTAEEYKDYFEPLFSEVKIKPCTNSITPRLGFELFVEITK